jgi:ketosteroid isomerase-like protein
MDPVRVRSRRDREASLLGLAAAYQHRALEAFEAVVRRDVALVLAGNSRLAGTFRGYKAFRRHLELLREVMSPARKPSTFEHINSVTVLRQIMIVSGPRHDVEMTIAIIVRYDDDGLIESLDIEPEDQGLFDYVVSTSATSQTAS